jgi:aspartate/tyrosine/aromatic aminotransferase
LTDNDRLLSLAKSVNIPLPSWATHVAVRNNGAKVEAAAFDDNSKEFIDEKPIKGKWTGCFKKCYWTFFKRKKVQGGS